MSTSEQIDPDILLDLPFPFAVGITDARGTLAVHGEDARVFDLASVSKPIAALGVLVAVERGLLDLDEPVGPRGPEGATVRHLLAHTAGCGFDGTDVLAEPGVRRIYSNTGFEILGEHVADAVGTDLSDWMEEVVVAPLGLDDIEVDGSPAAGYRASIRDLLAVGRELLAPTLISPDLHREATSVQFPGLAGILPGYGRQKPNDWGLGLEIRDGKSPHWTGLRSSPRTVGHFGQAGSFLWADPDAGLAAAFLGTEPFGPLHVEAWPQLTDALLDAFGTPDGRADADDANRDGRAGGATGIGVGGATGSGTGGRG